MSADLEIEIFKRFIAKNRKDRFIWNLSNPKRREKIFDDLRDTRHFDESKVSQVDHADDVIKFLTANRASREIYVISSDEDIDGKTVSIEQLDRSEFWMAEEIVGYCKAAKVGFFKNHEEWYFLLK